MSKKVASKGALKPLAVAAASALSVVAAQQVHADSTLYPYVVVSPTVTTLISAAYSPKPGADVAASELHYRSFYKPQNPGNLSEVCQESNVFRPTSVNDIVTFDIGGKFGMTSPNPGVLFNDPSVKANYNGADFDFLNPAAIGIPATRGFLIVNETTSNDGTLYGEAMILEIASGAAWGYRAYNSRDFGNFAPIIFANSSEIHGEVLMEGELAPIEIYPLQEWTQKLLVTPIAGGLPWASGNSLDQADNGVGDLTVNVELTGVRDTYSPPNGPQINDIEQNFTDIFDRDENPVSGVVPKSVTCVGALTIDSNAATGLLSAATANRLANGGWTYVNPYNAATADAAGLFPKGATNQAVVQKLVYNNGDTVNGEATLGNAVVNNNVWLEDSSCTSYDDPRTCAANINTANIFAGTALNPAVNNGALRPALTFDTLVATTAAPFSTTFTFTIAPGATDINGNTIDTVDAAGAPVALPGNVTFAGSTTNFAALPATIVVTTDSTGTIPLVVVDAGGAIIVDAAGNPIPVEVAVAGPTITNATIPAPGPNYNHGIDRF